MLEGKVSSEGLTALAEGTDLAAELARTLTEGLRGVESAEVIWRRLSPAATPTAVLQTAPARATYLTLAPRPTHVVLTTIEGRTRHERAVPVEELDQAVRQLGFHWLLPDPTAS